MLGGASSELLQYGVRGPTPDLLPVPWSGALTGVVAAGGFEPVAEGTASVCEVPALPIVESYCGNIVELDNISWFNKWFSSENFVQLVLAVNCIIPQTKQPPGLHSNGITGRSLVSTHFSFCW